MLKKAGLIMARLVGALCLCIGIFTHIANSQESASLQLSSVVEDGAWIPAKYTGEGDDVSPLLRPEEGSAKRSERD